MRKKVFICSPFRGDMEGNARRAAAYSRMACEEGYLPIAPHLLFPQFLNEGIEEERRLGIAMGMELLALCDEVWKPPKGWRQRSHLPQGRERQSFLKKRRECKWEVNY